MTQTMYSLIFYTVIFIACSDCRQFSVGFNDLNCQFDHDFCNWTNLAIPPENSLRWRLSDGMNPISDVVFSSNSTDNNFVYIKFLKRGGNVILASQPIQQSEKSTERIYKVEFKTYITGLIELHVCQRFVSPQFSQTAAQSTSFDCLRVSNISRLNEWRQQTVLLQTNSSSYQIFFRSSGTNASGLIALDDVKVTPKNGLHRNRRHAENQIKVITYDNWQKLKDTYASSGAINIRPFLVVSDQVNGSSDQTTEPNLIEAAATSPPDKIEIVTSTTAVSCTISADCSKKDDADNATIFQSSSKDDVSLTSPRLEDPQTTLHNLANWVQVLRNVAPMIPMIPSLINSFKYNDPPSSAAAYGAETYRDPTLHTGDNLFSWKPPSNVPPIPIKPISVQNNVNPFRLHSERNVVEETTTVHPTAQKNNPDNEDINLSSLTVNELKTLELIHKKIFPIPKKDSTTVNNDIRHTVDKQPSSTVRPINIHRVTTGRPEPEVNSQSFVVFDKPKQIKSEMNDTTKQFRYLTPQMIRELNMISSMPDLEELTEGLDLSLLNKPGGFAKLKQQFLDRLFQRIPLSQADNDLLRTS